MNSCLPPALPSLRYPPWQRCTLHSLLLSPRVSLGIYQRTRISILAGISTSTQISIGRIVFLANAVVVWTITIVAAWNQGNQVVQSNLIMRSYRHHVSITDHPTMFKMVDHYSSSFLSYIPPVGSTCTQCTWGWFNRFRDVLLVEVLSCLH